ncbi:MAG: hypothetical protein V3T90_08140, partial [Anaerolineae bacterium]
REGVAGEELALGLLRGSLSLFYHGRVPRTKTAQERRTAVVEAVELGDLAVADFRAIGHSMHLATSLNNASLCYSDLAGLEETGAGRVRLLEQAVAAIEEAAGLYRALGLQADLAMSLNNASLFYSDLAGLEETGAGRVRLLEQALAAIEEAAGLYRDLGLQAELASSLNNASLRYSDLAGLEETGAGRVRLLEQTVAAIEEAVRIHRDLGLQAELASSLNNAARAYFGMMSVGEDDRLQVEWLRKALQAIEEAVDIFRAQGIIHHLMVGLRNVVILHLELVQHTGELDRTRVLALCQEGEALCGPMEDTERLAFFRQVRQQLQG